MMCAPTTIIVDSGGSRSVSAPQMAPSASARLLPTVSHASNPTSTQPGKAVQTMANLARHQDTPCNGTVTAGNRAGPRGSLAPPRRPAGISIGRIDTLELEAVRHGVTPRDGRVREVSDK